LGCGEFDHQSTYFERLGLGGIWYVFFLSYYYSCHSVEVWHDFCLYGDVLVTIKITILWKSH
jgi:hypothetical protein